MRKFKQGDRDQLVLPPNLHEWLPENHLARLILEVIGELDLSSFYEAYDSDKGGRPPYDPSVMLSLLLYGYCTGLTSSRKIEQATWTDVALRYLSVNLHPDHDTISEFRKRHKALIKQIFQQVVKVAMSAKIVRLGHVSVDGTKVRSNASKTKRRTEEQLRAELGAVKQFEDLLDAADAVDAAEDEEFGKGINGYALPDSMKTKEDRRRVIQEALKALEEQKNDEDMDDPDGTKRAHREQVKNKKHVHKVNTTDPDSRTMRFANGTLDEGYNSQIVVDDEFGIIVAADVWQDGGDQELLTPMVLQVGANTGWLPERVTADTGYFSEKQITDPQLKNVDLYVKPQKIRQAKPNHKRKHTFSDGRRDMLETELGRTLYAMRKTLVEPVFGAIKHARGFRQFRLRGLDGVQAEWALICVAHNLKKMFKASGTLGPLLA